MRIYLIATFVLVLAPLIALRFLWKTKALDQFPEIWLNNPLLIFSLSQNGGSKGYRIGRLKLQP